MNDRNILPLQLVLNRHDGLGRIKVDMQAFFEFSFDLAEDLADLESRWTPETLAARTVATLAATR